MLKTPFAQAEVDWISEHYVALSDQQMGLILNRTLFSVRRKRHYLGLMRGEPRTGNVGRDPLADVIRERALASGWSFRHLARACGTTGQFLADSNLRINGLNLRATGLAIELVGGELRAVWDE